MSEACLIWLYMWTDWVRRKPPQIKKKNLVKLGISTILELSLFHPSTQRQETRSLHIWPSPLSGSKASPPQGRKTMTHPEGQGGSLSDTFQLLHRLERHGHFFVGFVCECSVPLRRWHWRCVCSVLLEECFSYSYQYCHVSCMLPLC